MDAFIKALEARIEAAGLEVEKLIRAGETRAAEIKAAIVAELKALLAEIQQALGQV